MNKNEFLRRIESSRDCEQGRLDEAVKKGLARAKSERFDSRKLLMLAAASVFTLIMCFTVNLRPVKAAADEYYRNWNTIPPGSVEVLDGYLRELAVDVKRYLGGE
jgi:hypothetical protein